jgi:hypothetical protein
VNETVSFAFNTHTPYLTCLPWASLFSDVVLRGAFNQKFRSSTKTPVSSAAPNRYRESSCGPRWNFTIAVSLNNPRRWKASRRSRGRWRRRFRKRPGSLLALGRAVPRSIPEPVARRVAYVDGHQPVLSLVLFMVSGRSSGLRTALVAVPTLFLRVLHSLEQHLRVLDFPVGICNLFLCERPFP